jgi:hypothetical protein
MASAIDDLKLRNPTWFEDEHSKSRAMDEHPQSEGTPKGA